MRGGTAQPSERIARGLGAVCQCLACSLSSLIGPCHAESIALDQPRSLHRLSLDELLLEFEINDRFTEHEKDHLNRVWHGLQLWPDPIPGLTRFRKGFV